MALSSTTSLGTAATAVGAAGTALVGILALEESNSALKLVSIEVALAGVVSLNLSGVTPVT
ncbi:MAG: hypothetical protein ACLQFR_03460 [Streptosporangiaceae bacterium]